MADDWELIDDDAPGAHVASEIESARLLLPGGRTEHLEVVEGATVAELLSQVPAELHELLDVYNHGQRIVDWHGVRLRRGDRLLVTVTPQGGGGRGKQIVGAILMIVVAIVAPYAAAGIYTAAGGTFVAANAGLVISGITVGITMVAGMVISAMIRPPSVSTGSDAVGGAAAKSYSLTGQSNSPRPYNSCFVVYGMHKLMPAMATNPNVDNWASESRLTALYDFGLGYVHLYDIRIGDVPIAEYSPALVNHPNSFVDDLQLLANRIGYDQYALALNRNDPVTVRTKPDTFCADLDINYPKGIFQASKWGPLPYTADYVAYWRRVGDAAWNLVPIDWYYGAAERIYLSTKTGIQYSLPGYYDWANYRPDTSPNDLRAKAQAYFQATTGQAPVGVVGYNDAQPNTRFPYAYPDGPIDEASYFTRYPEIRATGWTRSATQHFEAIGSRESREPGVRVIIGGSLIYNAHPVFGSAPALHGYDRTYFPNDVRVGLWQWIDQGGKLLSQNAPDYSARAAPWQWRIAVAESWDANVYLARYPDVANAGFDAWTHFTTYGAFESRDPYASTIDVVVQMKSNFVGSYWNRIFFVFPAPGEYELQVMRTDKIEDGTDVSIANTTAGQITQRFNESSLVLLRSYQSGVPVAPRVRHTMLEMRVMATDQLQGIVQNLSALCVSVLPVTSDGVNFWYSETRNPAWIALDILTSEKNPKPLLRSQVDWPSWLHLAAYCDAPRTVVINGQTSTAQRFTCDIIVDSFVTVKDLVESILSACRASMVLTASGTWGVLVDEEKATPRQLITPANSWGFSGARTFATYPHALRVNFINSDNNYNKDETLVYWDGYDASNATIFETLESYGITDYQHAWAYGRYMMAQGIQRSELFTLSMDVENLLVQRGDLVYVTHDVPLIGGLPSRVVLINDNPYGVRVDALLPFNPTGYAVRLSDGTVRTGTCYGDANWPEGWVALDSNAGIAPDDLIVLGEYTRQTQPYLVQRITPGVNLTAELTLCKYAPGVYQADQGALPPWDAGLTHDYLNGTDLVCVNLAATQTLFYLEREPRVTVQLTWQTKGWALNHHVLTVRSPSGESKTLSDNTPTTSFAWNLDALRDGQWFDVALQFKVVPVNSFGFEGVAAYGSITLVRDHTPPLPVIAFGANVQKENVDLFWTYAGDPDPAGVVIRYTPNAEAPNWDGSQEVARVAWPGTKTSVGARTGAYGLRVIDTSDNVSDVVWRRTTVAVLPDINVVTNLNDRDLFPRSWPGETSHVVVAGNELHSEGAFGAIYPLGYYYCSAPVDLGDVYEVRVTSKIEGYGATEGDYMSNWLPSLADVTAMSHASNSLWDAWLEVRTANRMQMMSDWVPSISVINPIADAGDKNWSIWRPVQVGDFTARLLQFRIALQSKNTGVRTFVSSGFIEVDMPDRVDTYGDVAVPVAGLDFVFPVAFRVLQSVAITIDGNAQPVVAKVTNKTPVGLRVQLFNTQTAAAAAGQVDIMAEGYGRRRLTSI